MKKIFIAATVLAFLGLPSSLWAQEETQPDKKKDKETEEIIIRKNGDKEMNLNVEINGDKIIVNGKPLAEFKDDQVTINKRKMIVRDGDKVMSFDFGDGGRAFGLGHGFMNEWNDEKETSKAFLGVTTEKTAEGPKILEVVKESAAEKAGLKKDDIILKVGDEKVEDAETLSGIITSRKPKDEIKIRYKRNGKESSTKAILGEKKQKKSMAFSFNGPNGTMRSFSMPKLPSVPPLPNMEGLDNQELTELQSLGDMEGFMPRQKKLGLKIQDTEEGGNVKVIRVEDSSAAEKSGLKKDDLITEIDGQKVNNTDEAREQLRSEEGKTYKIKAKRNGTEMNFEVKIPRKLKTANL